jgi:regulator of ribonuclease activity A
MKTADLVDTHDAHVRFCNLQFTKLGRRRMFSGEIVTVRCFEDNTLLKVELGKPGHGKVLVVDGGGSTRCALVGDQIAALALANGWSGIVIHGAVRDSAEIDTMDIGVFALGTSPKKSAKAGAGEVSAVLAFGGVVIAPGMWLYADADGVLIADTKL